MDISDLKRSCSIPSTTFSLYGTGRRRLGICKTSLEHYRWPIPPTNRLHEIWFFAKCSIHGYPPTLKEIRLLSFEINSPEVEDSTQIWNKFAHRAGMWTWTNLRIWNESSAISSTKCPMELIFYSFEVLTSTTKLQSMSFIGPLVVEIHHIKNFAVLMIWTCNSYCTMITILWQHVRIVIRSTKYYM